MSSSAIIGLVNNIALLLALGLLYDVIGVRPRKGKPSVHQMMIGVVVGGIGIAVMSTPWELISGLFFDSCSVVLSISGLFFGTLPTLLAVLMTGAYRLYLGGAGAWAGVAMIFTSGAIGLAWRHLRHQELYSISLRELYVMGVVVHINMLLWILVLPWSLALIVLRKIGLVVMIIHPVGTMLLGWLMVNRLSRRQSEDVLRENECLLRAITDNYPNSYLSIIEKDYRIGFSSGQEFRKQGLNPDDFIGLTLEQIFGEQADNIKSYYEKTFSGEEQSFDLFINEQHQRYNTVPLYANDGSIYRILVVVENITERVLVAEDLQKTTEYLENLISYANAPIIVWDTDNKITRFNKAFERITGRSIDDVIGKEIDFLFPKDKLDQSLKHIQETSRGVRWETIEISIQHIDGTVRPVLWNSANIYSSDKKTLVATIAQGQDISERVLVEKKLRESETLFRAITEQSGEGIGLANIEGDYVTVNTAFSKMTGYSDGELLRMNVRDLLPPETELRLFPEVVKNKAGHRETELVKKDGAHFLSEISGYPVQLDNEKLVLGIVRDITERKQAEIKLLESEEKYRILLDESTDSIFSVALDGRYRYVNRAFAEGVGMSSEQIIGNKIQDIFSPEEAIKRSAALDAVIQTGEEKVIEVRVPRPEEDQYYVTTITPIKDTQGSIINMVCSSKNITERKRAEIALQGVNEQLVSQLASIQELESTLREQAVRDPLTGLFNRRYMEEILEQELAKVTRKKDPLSIVMLDLDNLKGINDLYGHVDGGDKALLALTETIRSLSREEDTFCRYAGDEFIVILYDTPLNAAYERALEWKEAVSKVKIKAGEKEFKISFSAGVAEFSTGISNAEGMIKLADQALYQAKDSGRNNVIAYSTE